MRTTSGWYWLLLGVIVVAPYLLGVPPRSARDWRCVTIAVAFLTWLLLGLQPAR